MMTDTTQFNPDDLIKQQAEEIERLRLCCTDHEEGKHVLEQEIERLRKSLNTINAEADRIRGGNGSVSHLVHCIKVQLSAAEGKQP